MVENEGINQLKTIFLPKCHLISEIQHPRNFISLQTSVSPPLSLWWRTGYSPWPQSPARYEPCMSLNPTWCPSSSLPLSSRHSEFLYCHWTCQSSSPLSTFTDGSFLTWNILFFFCVPGQPLDTKSHSDQHLLKDVFPSLPDQVKPSIPSYILLKCFLQGMHLSMTSHLLVWFFD